MRLPSERERWIRRRVDDWRLALKQWWRRAFPSSEIPTIERIRAEVEAFRAKTVGERMSMPGAAYANLSEQAFLLDLVDELSRQLAHYQKADTAPAPIVRSDRIDTDIDIWGAT